MKLSMLACAWGAAVLALAACGRGGPATMQWWAERKAATQALELWSVEATGPGARPVQVCMDTAMRLGLVKPAPAAGRETCTYLGKPVQAPGRYAFRCSLAGREWAVTSLWRGDRARDFTDSILISSLDPPYATYVWRRRYRRLGACPSGWAAGDSRTADGRRSNALIEWPAEASAPP
jgi:hypothetical protein